MKRARIRKRICGVLLACAMMLTLLPATAFAADTAITATTTELATGNYILNDNVTLGKGPLTVPSGATVTLNLESGKTLTNQADQHTIVVKNGGSLTITGSGTVDNVSHAKAAIWNEGTVILNGGSYTRSKENGLSADDAGGNSYYALVNHGTMTINSDVSVTQNGHFSSLVENGYYNYSSGNANDGYVGGINAANPTLTINGGAFEGGLNSVKNDDGGVLTITGGTFTNTTQAAVLNWNKATISGGTFTVNAGGQNCIINGAFSSGASAQDLGQLTINGGSFTSPSGIACVYNYFTNATPVITGGTFSSDVSEFVGSDSVVAKQEDGSFVVEPLTADNAVARIGDAYYKTLADAVTAVPAGGTIVMLKNAAGSGIGTFAGATEESGKNPVKDFTIDFGGFTYTCTGPAVGSNGTESQAFHLEKGAAVTLKNGTITSTANSGAYMLVQNYCDLTLMDMTLDGTNIGAGQYTMSNNCGKVNIMGATSIIAPTSGFAFDACWAPNQGYPEGAQVTVNTTGVISGNVEFGLWGTMSENEVETTLTIQNGNFNGSIVVGNALVDAARTNITITGGTFSTKPDDAYIANGYELTGDSPWVVSPKAGMEAEAAADESGNVSASVTGLWTGNESQEEDNNVESTDSSIEIDVTTKKTGITSTAVDIDSATLESVQTASVSTVTIDTDVGTLAVNKQAWSAITDNAKGSSVTLSMEKDTTSGLVYTLTAEDADGNEVYAKDDAAGSITVTVAYGGSNPTVYYLGANGPEKVTSTFVGGMLSWTVSHFSDYLIQGDDTVALVTADGATTEYDSLDEALAAATQTTGAVLELVKSASITQKVTIDKSLTINGNGNTITGVADDANANFEVTGGTFTISDVTLKDFGSSAGTNSGIAVIKVPDSAANATKVVATNVNITNFCRSAYDIRSGSFEITGGTIDSGAQATGENSRLTKGIMAGYGSDQVTGTITGVTITNTDSNYSDWNSAGIEIYQNANVTISECAINNVQNGVHVDNYYSAGGNNTTANAVIQNTDINASNNAVMVFGKESNAPGTATVSVTGGTLNGEVKIQDGTKQETVSLSGTTITGDVTNENGTMGIVNTSITGTAPANTGDNGVTYVNTTVNGTMTNTTVVGKEAMVNGVQYATLEDAIAAAKDGQTVVLLNDVVLDGKNVDNNSGILTITKDIILDGNKHKITATGVVANADTAAGPSMINIQGDANVTVKNLTIDGEGTDSDVATDNTKHGLNVYGSGTAVTVENVTIKNGNGYAIVANGSTATINGLTTENNGWGGINVDSKSAAAALTINDATINEENSVKIENGNSGSNANPVVEITDGTFQYITTGAEIAAPNLTISGGKFATGEGPADAIDVSKYLEDGLVLDNNGNVTTPAPSYPTGGGGSSSTPSYSTTVEKTENGTVTVAPQNASKGTTVTVTVKPDDGFVLNTLTVTDANGSQVTLTDKGNGQYTFAMPASAVTVKAVFAKIAQTNPFTDVYASDYYYDAVLWAVENGVTNGMTATTFNPNVTVSRAQMVTFLWRAHGSPKVTAENPFTDVNANEYYYDAVLWAVANGVTNGTSPTTFSPNAAVTRSQAVTFQWRAAGSPAASGSSFADVAAGTWYTDAVTWAVANGITNGTSATTFSPDTAVSRAQAVTFLYRELK